MNHSGNFTLEGIHQDSERVTWIIYNTLIILSSLIGDTIILIATTKYHAIKLHRIIVVMVQHLAVTDLLLTLFKVLPMTVSLVTNSWVLGGLLCCLNPLVGWLCNPVTIFLTCFLATSKLLIVKHPLRALTWSKKEAQIACVVVWVVCLLNPVQIINYMVLIQRGTGGTFLSYLVYECVFDRTSIEVPSWLETWMYMIYGGVTFLIMLVTCVLTSVLLMLFARKAARRQGRKLHWQGMLTISLTAVSFIVSYFPFFIMRLTSQMFAINYSITALRTAHFLPHINIMANFFIYSVTVRSFREFLLARFRTVKLNLGLLKIPEHSTVIAQSTTLDRTKIVSDKLVFQTEV